MNIKAIFCAALLALLMMVSGCATSPGGARPEPEPEIIYEPSDEAPLVLIPNPYDQQRVKVSEQVKSAFNQGVALMQAENWPQAEVHFDNLTQANPELSGPWLNLAICLWRQQQFDAAAQAFEQAITVNSLNNEAYNAYAVMVREQGDFQKAETLYKKALSVWPHNAVVQRNLGVLYDMYMGRFDDALAHFEMSARIMGEPDKELKGWIIDIKRRQAKAARERAKQQPAEQPAAEASQ
ncbi:MAG TPA: tetratricopeptide repeat protein [Marinagarivorans sp.]